MDMGPLGKYEFLRHAGRAPDGAPMGHGVFGAVMPKMEGMPVSAWTYYFRVPDIDVAVAHINANGGSLFQDPHGDPGRRFRVERRRSPRRPLRARRRTHEGSLNHDQDRTLPLV